MFTVPLDTWIDQVGLRPFVDDHLRIHIRELANLEDSDSEALIRCIMISLRQELRKQF